MTILELSLLLIAIVLTVKAILFSVKRARLLISVLKLNSLDGAEVINISPLAFFYPRITKKPVCRVKVYSKIYAVRLYSGKGHAYAVHIVDSEYSAVFMKTGGATKVRRFVRSVRSVREAARVYFPKTVLIPKIDAHPDDIEIMIFSPTPRELTYVSPERTSIKVAFTGDEVYGRRIFTRRTFVSFIDRDTRGFYDELKKRREE